MPSNTDIQKEIQALVASRIRRGPEGTEGQRLGRAEAEAGPSRQERPTNTENRGVEKNVRRAEYDEQRASGSKRKRANTDGESDEEYHPQSDQSEVDAEDGACWNCQQRGQSCKRTR